jgi:hypothetical protein
LDWVRRLYACLQAFATRVPLASAIAANSLCRPFWMPGAAMNGSRPLTRLGRREIRASARLRFLFERRLDVKGR